MRCFVALLALAAADAAAELRRLEAQLASQVRALAQTHDAARARARRLEALAQTNDAARARARLTAETVPPRQLQ